MPVLKFSNKDYSYSGGLHGVGVSVVNALSSSLTILIKRDGQEHRIGFNNGIKTEDLSIVKNLKRKKTGTSLQFYPDISYFDRPTFSKTALKML